MRRGGAEPRSSSGRTASAPWRRAHPSLSFVVGFAVWFAVMELLLLFGLPNEAYESYLEGNAVGATLLLEVFGLGVERLERLISYGACTLEVAPGCDAAQPLLLFVSAVLAFPASLRSRLAAILVGGALLIGLNLVRIASLVWILAHYGEHFELMHLAVWPALIVLLALFLWAGWATLSRRPAQE